MEAVRDRPRDMFTASGGTEGRPLAVAAWGAEEGEAPGLRAPSSGEEAWEGAWLQCEQLSPEWQVWVAPLMRTLWDRRSRGARKAIE